MLLDHEWRSASAPTLAAALLAVTCAWAAPAAADPQCIASFREIKFPDGSARVKNYVCKTEGAAKPEIQVEFNRLSEAAAGSFIMEASYPHLERSFDGVRVLNNAVAAEAKNLFEKFGTKKLVGEYGCSQFEVSTAAGGTPFEAPGICQGQRTLWYMTEPTYDAAIDMPLLADLRKYQTTSEWPKGYGFFYSPCSYQFDPIDCTILWRSARRGDFTNYLQNKLAYDRALGLDDLPVSEDVRTEIQEHEADRNREILRYFALIDYLTEDTRPDDFLIIAGSYEPGCDMGGLSLYPRLLILDVALIQNLTDGPISISGLGMEAGGLVLRPVGAPPGKVNRIDIAGGELRPGEVVAMPLSISFVVDDSLRELFADKRSAEITFKKIRSAKRGTIFQTSYDEPPIRKSRESFKPPTSPNLATYAFGPEIRLSGISVGGKPIIFDQSSRNFMKLATYSEEGSCPFLYSWNESESAWVHHGKVIHEAIGKDKEMTERKVFLGFRSKFRLAEEELEVSYIDRVKLDVEMHDGTHFRLKPDLDVLAAQDGLYAIVKAGDSIEFKFDLPAEVNPEDVMQSTLAITGYYRRYSDLLMASQ